VIRRWLLVSLVTVPAVTVAQSENHSVALTGFVDTYFAWDVGQPDGHARSFTTQAARHNEFAINLAHLSLALSKPGVRARVALQAGTAVEANYAGEVEGGTLARHIQEAVVGVAATDDIWVDAGIFFSHLGAESWISRDNPTYTRSFTAEYTPYYSAGVKATWAARPDLSFQVHVINGWQVIADPNAGKSLGFRVDWVASPRLTLAASGYLGNDRPEGDEARARKFAQLLLLARPSDRIGLWLTADHGWQDGADGEEADPWWSVTAIAEARINDRLALSGRAERYVDRSGVVTAPGFEVTAFSLGTNVALPNGVLWRNEWRVLRSDQPLWPGSDGLQNTSGHLVSSLALSW
jgi:hypothetical protein